MATFHQKIKLLKGLVTGDIAHTGPFWVTIDVTRRCNLLCPGCQYHSPILDILSPGDHAQKDIPVNLLEKLCNELKIMGTNQIVLTGEGEPFLHPHLFDLISIAKKAGFNITLLTNGTFLDKNRIQSIIDSRLDILKVSLWASSPEEYERNYPEAPPGNFKKIVDGLKLLTSLKAEQKSMLPSVFLHQPITRHNFQNIDMMVDLAKITGSHALSFAPLKPWSAELSSFFLSPDEEQLLRLSLNRIRKQLETLSISHNINETLLRYKMGEDVWKKLPCYIAWVHTRIRVDGTVRPCHCCDLAFGNIHENTFHEAWNGPAIRAFRRQTLTCSGLASMGEHCACRFCCFVSDNMRVHQLFRWLHPFAAAKKGKKPGGEEYVVNMLTAKD